MAARLTLVLFLLFFPFAVKPSVRGGVGTGEHTGTQEQLTALRANWIFDWGANNGWARDAYSTEYVPMAWGAYCGGWESREVKRWLVGHPTSYVLILNEPNDRWQANLTCEEAGQSVEQYANDLWADYPNAKLIIGGILVGDYEARNVAAGIAYANCMLDNISSATKAAIAGWNFHFYPFYSSDPAVSKAAITELATWTHGQGKVFWLTEVGLIGWAASWPDAANWMREMVRWLDESGVVERWAWFIMERDPVWPCPAALDLWDANGITEWGRLYAGR